MMEKANNILLKLLGVLLLAAAVMKGHELLTVPVANADIWSNRAFLIFTVEFELALGIWLLSGLFKRAAWLAALGCFVLFSGVTLYKALTGAASCGCFGTVQVNPWITLLAIDLPAVVLLSVFRPKLEAHRVFSPLHWLQPRPNPVAFGLVFVAGLTAVAASAPVLILKEPAKVTAWYEILEPSEWVGKELPILANIDIADQLREGNWLIMLYHHGCPGCAEAIPKIEQMARDLEGNGDVLRFAFIEVPPYAPQGKSDKISPNTAILLGKLDTSKEWFVTTPSISLIWDRSVIHSWQDDVPDFAELVKYSSKSKKRCNVFHNNAS